MITGSIKHELLEKYFKQQELDTNEKVIIDKLLSKFKNELFLKNPDITMVEKELYSEPFKNDIRLHGIIDILQMKDNKALILDWKTGNYLFEPDTIQSLFYAYLVMSNYDIERVKKIAQKSFVIEDQTINLLTEDEAKHLSIMRGTLTDEEREKINEHAKTTYDMLKMITFPKKYSKVTEIASGHHEKINGKGYPMGLKGDEISFETRMLAIVDILEALTASDRPYKRAKTEDETFEILEDMVKKNELDAGIVSFIKKAGIFEKYIQKEEIEEVV